MTTGVSTSSGPPQVLPSLHPDIAIPAIIIIVLLLGFYMLVLQARSYDLSPLEYIKMLLYRP